MIVVQHPARHGVHSCTFDYVCFVLQQRMADKVGPGIRRVIVAQHPARHGVHCFTLQRVDGSTVNFSYRKTLNALLGKPWSDTDLPDLVRLQQLVGFRVRWLPLLVSNVFWLPIWVTSPDVLQRTLP